MTYDSRFFANQSGAVITNSMSGTSQGPVIQIGQVGGGVNGLPGA